IQQDGGSDALRRHRGKLEHEPSAERDADEGGRFNAQAAQHGLQPARVLIAASLKPRSGPLPGIPTMSIANTRLCPARCCTAPVMAAAFMFIPWSSTTGAAPVGPAARTCVRPEGVST